MLDQVQEALEQLMTEDSGFEWDIVELDAHGLYRDANCAWSAGLELSISYVVTDVSVRIMLVDYTFEEVAKSALLSFLRALPSAIHVNAEGGKRRRGLVVQTDDGRQWFGSSSLL